MPRTSGDPYNRLYEGMLPFHAHFRHSYASIQRALPLSQSLPRRNLELFLLEGIQLCQRLEMHHRIEETYIFPLLAKRMPSFDTGKVDGAHRQEHAIMHERLDHFEQYLNTVGHKLKSGQGNKAHSDGCGQEEDREDSRRKPWPRDIYDAEKMKELVDQLGQALFPHLAAEEESLKAKSMRAAGWTEAELARIPL